MDRMEMARQMKTPIPIPKSHRDSLSRAAQKSEAAWREKWLAMRREQVERYRSDPKQMALLRLSLASAVRTRDGWSHPVDKSYADSLISEWDALIAEVEGGPTPEPPPSISEIVGPMESYYRSMCNWPIVLREDGLPAYISGHQPEWMLKLWGELVPEDEQG